MTALKNYKVLEPSHFEKVKRLLKDDLSRLQYFNAPVVDTIASYLAFEVTNYLLEKVEDKCKTT